MTRFAKAARQAFRGFAPLVALFINLLGVFATPVAATPFTMQVPGTGITLPDAYPEAGGVAVVMIGENGNIYYQFSDPTGAFVGFQYSGQPARFRGNPFTINDPIPLDCGVRTCVDYFGGGIARMHVRFSAYDGDTQPGGFDHNDIELVMNGYTVGNWSSITTEKTNLRGTVSYGFETGFGDSSFNTGWFSTSDRALLDAVLAQGETTTQVYDRDPNDNYWDFRRGRRLTSSDLETIAPGYEITKQASSATFAAVGDVITYDYVVSNIGSVTITNLSVVDDKIPNVICPETTIPGTQALGVISSVTCRASYTVTQADFDAGQVRNTATARGDVEYGVIGEVSDSAVVTSATSLAPAISVVKTASPTGFLQVGDQIAYSYEVTNSGNSSLSGIVVTDDKISGTICSVTSLLPGSRTTCSASYTVTQADLDAFAINGTLLTNTATVNATTPTGATISGTAQAQVSGPVARLAVSISKSALQLDFSAPGQVLDFVIGITNTGNVTWPSSPDVADPLVTGAGGAVSCPPGPVAPGQMIECSASYTVVQADLDNGDVVNTATASISIAGQSASASETVRVPARVTAGLTLDKRLAAASDTSYGSVGDQLTYEYVLSNTGTVTLGAASVSDDKLAVTCPAVGIAPGAQITCAGSAPYVIAQSDIDAGEVTNIATAQAQDPSGAVVSSGSDTVTVKARPRPALTMVKTAPTIAPADFVPGLVVTYTYQITNSGNITITDPITVTDDKASGPITCGSAALAPGASRSCSFDYTVTTADVLAGGVTNRAFAEVSGTVSNEDTATVPQAGAPGLSLIKTPGVGSFSAPGEAIPYTFTVTNSGDTTILAGQPISIDDPKIASVDCSAQPALLAPGGSFDCTGTYTGVTQAEIDAGEVTNSATASFTAASGPVTSATASARVPSAIVPGMVLDKQPPASFGAVGTVARFTFVLRNTSAQTIASAQVVDPLIPGLSCSFTNIAPNGSVSCTGDYTVTQADLDRGSITNTASATGTAPTGERLSSSDTATVLADPAARRAALSLVKTADLSAFAAVGDVIRYGFRVENTGTITLINAEVNDPSQGMRCIIPELVPGEVSSSICRASHTVTQADIDAGRVVNNATASAAGATSVSSTVTTPGPARSAALSLTKTADATVDVPVGQVITYTHVVRNSGNVTLTNVTLTDTHQSALGTANLNFAPSNVVASLAPGEAVALTTQYTVTQADIDAGADLTNTGSATATPPAGVAAPSASVGEVVDLANAAPALTVDKVERDGSRSFGAVGSSETYDFTVTNTGNVTLVGAVLTDDLTGFSCTLPGIAPGASVSTCLGGAALTSTYVITQADIDKGRLVNTATATAGAVSASGSVTLSGPTQVPSMSLAKTATAGAGFTAPGDVVAYRYDITNTGNVTLTGMMNVSDDKTTVICPALPVAGIAPGGVFSCTASYAVTQADLDAGSVTNTATASTNQNVVPGGPRLVSSPLVTETVAAAQNPALRLGKTIRAGTPSTYRAPGDVITYDFTVTNNGNVTIPAPITVSDDKIGAGLACGAADLAPGQSVTCTHSWTADQAAVDAGSVTNTASAVANFGGAPVPVTPARATALAVQDPAMTMVKTLVSVTNNSFAAGEIATYRYTVTNSGNVTITTEPVVTDNLITNPADISIDAAFPVGGLAPGASTTYTGVYTLTLVDIQLGSVTNTAAAQSGTVVSTPGSATVPAGASPVLDLVKQANVASVASVGDVVDYTYTVTNQSTGALSPAFANAITVSDDRISGPISCDITADSQLSVGESATCFASYTVTQADLDAGAVVNNAVAYTVFGGQDVYSGSDQVSVDVVDAPGLTLSKSVISGPDPAPAGAVLRYRIVAVNSGNQTLSNVVIVDPDLSAMTCTVGGAPAPAVVSLAPGDSLICEGDYTVTQADLDAQSLTNTAASTASNPLGTDVSATAAVSPPLATAAPAFTLAKSLASGDPSSAYSAVGQDLTYVVTVRNTGNVTLDSVTVTDSLVPGTCTVNTLAPGGSDASCRFVYTVTQADIDAGQVVNTVDGTALPASPGAAAVTATDSLTARGPARAPDISISKSADLAVFDRAGQVITYTYRLGNTGNVTLTAQPVVSDDKIPTVTCEALPAGGLAPLDFITCSGRYTVTQADVDQGGVSNIATVSSAQAPYDPANPGGARAGLSVPSTRSPAVQVVKTPDVTTGASVGQVITYRYAITNTGNVTLSDLNLTDTHLSASGSAQLAIAGLPVASLAPGARVERQATYTVTQADIDAGQALTNTVDLRATDPAGSPVTAQDAASVTPAARQAGISAIKTVQGSTGQSPGDTVTFAITVRNTGNVTLTGITLSDQLRRADGSDITPAPQPRLTTGDGVALSPGEVWTYAVTHRLTQVDIDAGGLSNSAIARGSDPTGAAVQDRSDPDTPAGSAPTRFPIAAAPALETRKTVSQPRSAVGETVGFAITVRNTGNVTLRDVAIAQDQLTRADGSVLALNGAPQWSGADQGSVEGALKVGETATYTASYTLVQADIDAGGISNTAVAIGTPPIGAPIRDAADTPAVVKIAAAPSITLDKTLGAGGPVFGAVGDVLTFRFRVTNTGNVTLTDPVVVSDPLIAGQGGAVNCPAPPLAPGAQMDCSGSYRVTQADIDAGAVENTATAAVGAVRSAPDSVRVPALQKPGLSVVKTAEPIASAEFIVGRVVNYTYLLRNTGNVTITDPITLSDNRIANVSCPPLPTGGLAPNATQSCTASYTITGDDVRLGVVTNLALAESGTTRSPRVSETVPAGGIPALSIDKARIAITDSAGAARGTAAIEAVGDRITYRFTVTNSGQVSFANPVVVQDDHFADPIVCYAPSASNPDLIPGEVTICEAIYTVTQADLDAGAVVNEAYAQTEFGTGPTIVTSDPDRETTPVLAAPALSVVKSADRTEFAAVGDQLTYSFVITNTGNQSVQSVDLTDPLLPGISCSVAVLAPGARHSCSGSLTVTQAQMDAGQIVNQATVAGVSPLGAAVTARSNQVTVTAPPAASVLRLDKTAPMTAFGATGTEIPYQFTVTNDGPFTLLDLRLTDPLVPGYSCAIARLAPGQSDAASCVMRYTVTQADVDAGRLTNTATVTGRSPFGRVSSATDSLELPGPMRAPALDIVKTVDIPATTLGTVVTYRVSVRNSGNLTLSAPVLSDEMRMIDNGRPTALTTPLIYVSGDVDGNGALDVGESWVYTATYRISQAAINASGVENIVRARATAPDGSLVAGVSDDGIAHNGDANPTLVPITADPVLDVRKVITTPGSAVGDEVVFRIEVANRGNVDVSSITLTDQLTRRDGLDLSGQIVGPERIAPDAGAAVLSPGALWAWEVHYTLTQDDLNAGGLSNIAIAEGQSPDGGSVRVVSVDGDPDDGNPVDDPTVLLIAPAPVLDVTKLVTSAMPAKAGDPVRFAVQARNTGNVTLAGLTMTDRMEDLAGAVLTPAAITPDPALAVDLEPGGQVEWIVDYTVTQQDVDVGGIQNSATVTGTTPAGATLTDVSDDGDDSDGNAVDDPTVVAIISDPTLNVEKAATIPERISGTQFRTTFTITIENAGNVTHRDLSVVDDLTDFVRPARLLGVSGLTARGFTQGATASDYDGVAQTQLLAAGAVLAPGNTGVLEFVATYDVDAGSPGQPNVVRVSSDRTETDVAAQIFVRRAELAADILADKAVVTPGPYRAGAVIAYRLAFTNRNMTAETGLVLVDRLPEGMLYVADSARVDGTLIPAPAVEGQILRWAGVDLAPGQTVTVDLSALLVQGAGRYINRAYALDRRGAQVSNLAEAVIEVTPEAVFDCSDVIGKVFDDLDMDGYQDDPRRAISEPGTGPKSYDAGRAGQASAPRTEAGLPGVRLVTLRGDIITTDEFGRFHVPCALLPGSSGANFTLKLDERSLPTGYRMTTENPRTMRLTAGIMTEMNFGATLADLVDITLTADVFEGTDPDADLLRAIDDLAARMQGRPVLLRVTYLRGVEPVDMAGRRLEAVERRIKHHWPGPLQPAIDTRIGRITP